MESRIERLCIERGLKMTGQRRVVARVLSEAGDHPDVEELYRRASALDQHISIATVYRTVRLFEEQGILERRDFGGGRARYEPTEDGPHYHLIDVETGKVIEFQDTEHERLMHAIAARLGFEVVSLRLELFGRAPGERFPLARLDQELSRGPKPAIKTRPSVTRPRERTDDPGPRDFPTIRRNQERRPWCPDRRRMRWRSMRAGAALPGLLSGDGRAPRCRDHASRRDRDIYDTVADHLWSSITAWAKVRKMSSAPTG